MKPPALGYLRTDISRTCQQRDEDEIRRRAKTQGYRLCKTVAFSADTNDPIDRLVEAVERAGVEAVFAPTLAHFGGTVPPALAEKVKVFLVAAEVRR